MAEISRDSAAGFGIEDLSYARRMGFFFFQGIENRRRRSAFDAAVPVKVLTARLDEVVGGKLDVIQVHRLHEAGGDYHHQLRQPLLERSTSKQVSDYRDLTEKGMQISGLSPDGRFVEIVEYRDHPWFLACQFHPELRSKPLDPHPLFRNFISASYRYKSTRVAAVPKA